MDDLTARALQNQSNANANYNAKLKREEEQKALTEAPAFITGYEGGKYLVQRLGEDPIATGVPVTNGILLPGQRVTTTGQFVDGMPRVQPVVAVVKVVQATANFKYLYSINDAEGRHLYVGGWQKTSVLAVTIPPGQTLINAQLDNLGGNKWSINYSISLGLSPDATYGRLQLLQAKQQSSIILQKLSGSARSGNEELTCRGYGFWNRDDSIQVKFNVTRDDDGYRVYERTGTGLGAGYYYDDYFGDRFLRADIVTTLNESVARSRKDFNAFVLPDLRLPQYVDDPNNNDWFFYQTLRVNQGATEGVARLLTGSLGGTQYPCWLDAQGVHRLPATSASLSLLDQCYLDIVKSKLYTIVRADLDLEQDKTLSVQAFSASLQVLKTTKIKVYKRDQPGNFVLHSASYHP